MGEQSLLQRASASFDSLRTVKRNVARTYPVALSFVAVLGIVGYATVSNVAGEMIAYGELINVAGQQRMLSQKTFLSALETSIEPADSREAIQSRLERELLQFEQNHNRLARQSAALPSGDMPPSIHAIYFGEPELDRRVSEHIALLSAFVDQPTRGDINNLSAYSRSGKLEGLLRDLDAVVNTWVEAEASRFRHLRWINLILLAIVLSVLIIEARFLFAPIVRRLGDNIDTTQALILRAIEHDDLARLLDTANAPIIGIDALGKINEWNQSAERITGFTKEDAMGHDLVETFITDDHKEPVRDVLVRALAGDETSNYEFPLLTKSGETVHLLLNATTRRSSDASVLGVIGIGQDITARLEQEAMLRHRAKLESIGSLTGGIAHDFNNLLTVISGNLMLLEPHDEDDAEILEDARKAALDGAELVRGLLAFSRQQQLTPRWHNIRALLSEFQRSLVRSIGEAISLEIVLDDAGGAIFVDRTQFEAALLNLCINARDAISGSGQIRIEVHLHSAESELLSSYGISGSDFGSFALIRVTDSGCGIEPHVLDKITEPFFTTKQAGEGSGLGLSSVAGFVKQSGGGLRIESEVGVGTLVSLLLPHGEGEESGSTPRTRAEREAAPSTGRGRTVLVVDDEPGVRKLAVRWLRQQGYHVLEAKNGDDALKLIEELDGAIDVVFSDIVMPGVLDGLALAKEVARRFPNIGIQLATGYDQERRFQAGSKEQMQFPVLIKPYDLNDLAASIHAQVRERG